MPAPGVPATFRTSAVPMYRRYMGAAHTEHGDSIPSVESLDELVRHLQALQADVAARAQTLAEERTSRGVRSLGAAGTLRGRDTIKVEDASGTFDAGDGLGRRRTHVQRTYARADGARAKPGAGDSSASDSDGEVPLAAARASAASPAAPRVKMRRAPLGVRLRLTQPDESARLRAEARVAPAPAPVAAMLSVADEPEAAPFVDDTTFSWDAPTEPDATILPRKEAIRRPRPYPTHPLDVHEDFADCDWRERDAMYTVPLSPTFAPASSAKDAGRGRPTKEASQVPAATFFHYADAYFKPVTEDDLAWLSAKSDDPAPFHFPELGRPYRQVWEQEDRALQGMLSAPDDAAAAAAAAAAPTGDAAPGAASDAAPTAASSLRLRDLTDAHMYSRTAHGGPLLERLTAALLPMPAASVDGPADARDVGPPDVHKPWCDAEAQARQACEAVGLLESGAPVRWEAAADGPVAAALRAAQSRLRQQMAANEQRMARLFRVAKDRMAYQDYQTCLQAVDREIEASWTKRTRQMKASQGRKRKGEADAAPVRPALPDNLPELLQRRKKLKMAFEPLFATMPHASGPPTESIYHGIDST